MIARLGGGADGAGVARAPAGGGADDGAGVGGLDHQALADVHADVVDGAGAARVVGEEDQVAGDQVERVDRLFADVALRVEKTLSTVQDTVIGPVREGRALISAFKAAIQAVRELRQSGRGRQGRSEDDDALFI